MKRLLLSFVLGLSTSVFAAPGALQWSTGQMIGISEMHSDPTTFYFEVATGSRYGHVGLIAKEKAGIFVYESTPPRVQRTSLEKFLARATHNGNREPEFSLIELNQPLSSAQKEELLQIAKRMVDDKVPYNYSMRLNDKSVNCSEFIYRVFSELEIQDIAVPEPLGNSNLHAFQDLMIQWWRRPVPENELGVSPMAVMSSAPTHILEAKLPLGRIMSEREIYEDWEMGQGLEGFSQVTRVPLREVLELKNVYSNQPYRPYPSHWRH